MPTILSRFDMIFIVKDQHDVAKDEVCLQWHCCIFMTIIIMRVQRLAKHVMKVHLNAQQPDDDSEGELPLTVMKKYIAYCKR